MKQINLNSTIRTQIGGNSAKRYRKSGQIPAVIYGESGEKNLLIEEKSLVAALKQVRGVDVVQPERSQSVEADVKGTDKTVTINEIGVNGLDQPYLQDGRIPSKAGEVAVTKKFLADSGMAVGDSLTVTPVDTGTATSTVSDTDSADSGANGTEPTDEQADASQSAPSFPTELTITGTTPRT